MATRVMATPGLWEEYVDAYHDFWNYLERHEELLQRESNVNKVCDIMEECLVVNFSCVRDLMYTMRQFLGEKRFREQEREWRKHIEGKVEECIWYFSRRTKKDLEIKVNRNFLHNYRLSNRVQDEFTRRFEKLSYFQCRLGKLSLEEYVMGVYGQHLYRQQELILNFNILRTFCNNVMKYFKLEPHQCCDLLRRITDEALDPVGMCFQAAHWYAPNWYIQDRLGLEWYTLELLTRISIWPLHEPVITSYDDRKEALSKRWEYNGKPDALIPTIYIPCITRGGDVFFQGYSSPPRIIHLKPKSFPQTITDSPHFQRVMNIVSSEDYCLYPAETDPSEKSNWVYYIVMFDPTVSPEAAKQGYIGMTTQPLTTRMKQHARSSEDMIIHHNLALISQYAQQRGEDLSKYVAVFALGTTHDHTSCKVLEGVLIRESLEGCSVTNMKYGMNNKQSAKKPDEEKIAQVAQHKTFQKGLTFPFSLLSPPRPHLPHTPGPYSPASPLHAGTHAPPHSVAPGAHPRQMRRDPAT